MYSRRKRSNPTQMIRNLSAYTAWVGVATERKRDYHKKAVKVMSLHPRRKANNRQKSSNARSKRIQMKRNLRKLLQKSSLPKNNPPLRWKRLLPKRRLNLKKRRRKR